MIRSHPFPLHALVGTGVLFSTASAAASAGVQQQRRTKLATGGTAGGFAVDTQTFSQALRGQPIEEVLHSDPGISASVYESRVSSGSHRLHDRHDDASLVSKGEAGDLSSVVDPSANLLLTSAATQASVLTMLHPLDQGRAAAEDDDGVEGEEGYAIEGKDLSDNVCVCKNACECVSGCPRPIPAIDTRTDG